MSAVSSASPPSPASASGPSRPGAGPTTIRFSFHRVSLIARNTFLEAVRQRFFHFLVVVAAGLAVGARFLQDFNFGSSELKFITDLGAGAMVFFGSVLTIVAAAQLFFAEIENRTALTILAKPVLRAEFIFGKFAGVALLLGVFCVLIGVLTAGVLFWRETELMALRPDDFPDGRVVRYGDIIWMVATQWMKFGVLGAITILVASFANTNLFTVGASFTVLLICHLQYLARDSWERFGSTLAKVGGTIIGLIFPNFQLFNFGDQVALREAIDPMVALRVLLYGLAYVVILNLLAVFAFRRREI